MKVLGSFFENAYARDIVKAIQFYNKVSGFGEDKRVELWEIGPNPYGNRFVVITRKKGLGRNPKIDLIKCIR